MALTAARLVWYNEGNMVCTRLWAIAVLCVGVSSSSAEPAQECWINPGRQTAQQVGWSSWACEEGSCEVRNLFFDGAGYVVYAQPGADDVALLQHLLKERQADIEVG